MAKTKTSAAAAAIDPRVLSIVADFLKTHNLSSTAKVFAAEAGAFKTSEDVPTLPELLEGWEILKGSVRGALEGEESGSEADTESDGEDTSDTLAGER